MSTTIYLEKIGFDTAENEPSKMSMKYDIDTPTHTLDLPNKYRSGEVLGIQDKRPVRLACGTDFFRPDDVLKERFL